MDNATVNRMPGMTLALMMTSTGRNDRTVCALRLSCRRRRRAISCKVDANYLSLRFVRDELVPDAMHRLNINRPCGIGFELGAQAGDMIIHRTRDGIRIQSPDFVQQFVTGDHGVFP